MTSEFSIEVAIRDAMDAMTLFVIASPTVAPPKPCLLCSRQDDLRPAPHRHPRTEKKMENGPQFPP